MYFISSGEQKRKMRESPGHRRFSSGEQNLYVTRSGEEKRGESQQAVGNWLKLGSSCNSHFIRVWFRLVLLFDDIRSQGITVTSLCRPQYFWIWIVFIGYCVGGNSIQCPFFCVCFFFCNGIILYVKSSHSVIQYYVLSHLFTWAC